MIVRNFQQPGSTEPGLVSTGSLLRECQKYIERKGMTRTGFGRLAANDPNLLNRITREQPRPATIARIQAYMAANP